jgi:hypothetical protein
MAHGRQGPDIVMTIQYADQGDVEKMTSHELHRTPDGPSAIDPDRTGLNEILHGPRTQADAVRKMKEGGVRGPTAQAETPFVQMVISASPEFFRDDPSQVGTWDKEKLRRWKQSTLDWLKKEYGDDLAHVALHLDEDTPHMHVLVVPTYTKKPRKPGRQKKNETLEEFEARKAAAETGVPVRTMSRSSNAYWKQMWVRREARVSYWKAMEPLGLGYGHDFVGSGEESPDRKETAQWVREQAALAKLERAELSQRERKLDAREEALDRAFDRVQAIEEVQDRERRRLSGLAQALTEAHRLASNILRDLRGLVGLDRSLRTDLKTGLRELLSALQPKRPVLERDRIVADIESRIGSAPDKTSQALDESGPEF